MQDIYLKESLEHGNIAFPFAFYHVTSKHPRYVMETHWHEEVEICRVLSGTLTITIDGKTYEGHGADGLGDIFIINSGSMHSAIPTDCVYECVVFDLHFLLRERSLSNSFIYSLLYNQRKFVPFIPIYSWFHHNVQAPSEPPTYLKGSGGRGSMNLNLASASDQRSYLNYQYISSATPNPSASPVLAIKPYHKTATKQTSSLSNQNAIKQTSSLSHKTSTKQTSSLSRKSDSNLSTHTKQGSGRWTNLSALSSGDAALKNHRVCRNRLVRAHQNRDIDNDDYERSDIAPITSAEEVVLSCAALGDRDNINLICYTVAKFFALLHEQQAGYQLKTFGLLYYFLGICEECNLFVAAEGAGNKRVMSMRMALSYIHRNYQRAITLTELSDLLDLKPPSVVKLFKDIINKKPLEYINSYRIHCAMELLKDPKNTVTSVAYDCGFADVSYFSKVFKRYANKTPRDFLKSLPQESIV